MQPTNPRWTAAGNFVIEGHADNSGDLWNGGHQMARRRKAMYLRARASDIRYNGSTTIDKRGIMVTGFADRRSNYNSLNDALAGNFLIQKATPTLSVTNSPVVYNATPWSAVIEASLAGNPVPGTFSNVRYNSSLTEPTNAGIYAVTANFTPTDATNYETLVDELAGNFVILKANPTLSVTNSPVVYTGSPRAATVVCSVSGTVSNIKYNGSATVPTNAATYAVTANCTPTDATNNSLVDAPANFVIQKATPTIAVTNSPVVYNSTPWTAEIEASLAGNPVPGTVSDVRYNGSPTTPTIVGTYAVVADFAPTDTINYNSLSDAPAGNFVIQKATPTLSDPHRWSTTAHRNRRRLHLRCLAHSAISDTTAQPPHRRTSASMQW
jgi:hypothetical protein